VALAVTGVVQAKPERLQERRIRLGGLAAQNSNHRHRALLRMRRERPCGSDAERG
jgi:hypothetical protein